MADLLTMLENKLDELYTTSSIEIANSACVQSWDDYNHRAGYLRAIRVVGQLIKEVRHPEADTTGEIYGVSFEEEKK